MAVPAALLAAGVFLNAAATYTSNRAQAESELQNADFYDKQAIFARQAMSREAFLSRKKFIGAVGVQKSAFAKAGVSLTEGSSVGVIANTLAEQMLELDAIMQKGELEYKLASGRADQARNKAQLMSTTGYNLMSITGPALTSIGQFSGSKG